MIEIQHTQTLSSPTFSSTSISALLPGRLNPERGGGWLEARVATHGAFGRVTVMKEYQYGGRRYGMLSFGTTGMQCESPCHLDALTHACDSTRPELATPLIGILMHPSCTLPTGTPRHSIDHLNILLLR